MKASEEQVENREDELAEQEYRMSYVDLPGDIKLNIHNAVLEELGLKQTFKFTCMECGKLYETEIEGNLIEVYTDILSETHTETLEGICPHCQKIIDRKAEEERTSLWK